ncbi:MAG: hypothetical protein L0215_20445, partial [Gemmataceae bacterium]|nr:hypothetical protein [Gemmataceae bacterium]
TVWDGGAWRRPALAARATPQDAVDWCNDLDQDDAEVAFLAMQKLIAHPDWALPLFHKTLQPIEPFDRQVLQQFVDGLSHSRLKERQAAFEQLKKLGELARPALLEAVVKPPTLETQRRILELLQPNHDPMSLRPYLRHLRSIEVLEAIGTERAQALLAKLAQGSPQHRVTETAQAALDRLSKSGPGNVQPSSSKDRLLGESRFRHNDQADVLGYSPNGLYLFTRESSAVVMQHLAWRVADGAKHVQETRSWDCGHGRRGDLPALDENIVELPHLPRYLPNDLCESFLPAVALPHRGLAKQLLETSSRWQDGTGQIPPFWPRKLYTFSLSPDAQTFAATGTDGTITLVDVLTQTPYRVFERKPEGLSYTQFSPDGKLLVALGRSAYMADSPLLVGEGVGVRGTAFAEPPRIYRWELQTASPLPDLQGNQLLVRSMKLSPDGQFLASAGAESVAVWNLRNGAFIREVRLVLPLAQYQLFGPSVAFAPDGAHLAIGGVGHFPRLIELKTGRELAPGGHTRAVHAVAFSADGKLLASLDGTSVRVWDTASAKEKASWQAPRQSDEAAFLLGASPPAPHSLTFAAGGTHVLVGMTDGSVLSWDWRRAVTSGPDWEGFGAPHLGFAPSLRAGEEAALALGAPGDIVLQNLATGFPVRSYAGEKRTATTEIEVEIEAIVPTTPVAGFSASGQALAILGFENKDPGPKLSVWEPATGKLRYRTELPMRLAPNLFPHPADLRAQRSLLMVPPFGYGPSIVCGCGYQIVLPFPHIARVLVDPRGRGVVIAHLDTLYIWDFQARRVTRQFSFSDLRAETAVFINGGRRIAALIQEGLVRILDSDTGAVLAELGAPSAMCLSLSPDGRTLATGHSDTTVRLWSVDRALRSRSLKAATTDGSRSKARPCPARKCGRARRR